MSPHYHVKRRCSKLLHNADVTGRACDVMQFLANDGGLVRWYVRRQQWYQSMCHRVLYTYVYVYIYCDVAADCRLD